MKMNLRTEILWLRGMLVLALLFPLTAWAQDHVGQSVLSSGTWHRMSIAKEGVYKLTYTDFQSIGVDAGALNPKEIRVFGNPAGALPEKNSDARYDDLTEMAIYVSGAEDGRFDEDDYVLFYGQEPTRWCPSGAGREYERQRNPYTDTSYYYLCVDSGIEGLRISNQASLNVENATTVITEFPDFVWHEEELFSPFSSGRTWYGEQLTATDSVLNIRFILPDLIKDKVIFYRTSVMGRSKKGLIHYDIKANDNYLVADGTLNQISESGRSYGTVKDASGQIFSESDTVDFRLELRPLVSSHLLYLDYVEFYYWRELKRCGGLFPFRLKSSQLGAATSAIWVRNWVPDCQIWDVSDPMIPFVQEGVVSANNFVFAIEGPSERRYMTFTSSAALSVSSFMPVANQNLHAVSEADMLIITPSIFREYADRLADFHAQNDALLSVVADLDEIYNEFGTGTADPSAIRDFIRMVYQRSAGRLKYVTLFGKGSFDFRNIKGVGKNYVPPYEALSSVNQMYSFCTDDFYGMMDDAEGEDAGGAVDLGIGRLPVSTPQEAETVLQKIFHYADLSSTYGPWKTNHLYVADEENDEFIKHAEQCCDIIGTENHAMNAVKVYLDAYQQYSSPSGIVAPEANAELMRRFEKGVLVMQYHGHGGVRGLTEEQLLTNSDIMAMTNYDCMPFVLTATCEFSQFDDPSLVSAGELMFLQPAGGSVAMLTTVRPTQGSNSILIAKALMRRMYQLDGDKSSRFGDIIKDVKADPSNFSQNARSRNIAYVFFGDPALRFAAPARKIETLKINGQIVDHEIVLHAMSMVSVEGVVRLPDGRLDANFNGEVEVRFFDKESRFVTLGHDQSNVRHFSFFDDVLYQGRATVKDGRFMANFQVPLDINLQDGTPRFSYYAYDSIRKVDAIGVFENLTLGGIDPTMSVDDEGPRIDLYWNTPDFRNGDTVAAQGVLHANLYDAQGIYHYDFALGRDIILNGNVPGLQNLRLNDVYQPAVDDYRRGTVSVPLSELEPGNYTFSLRAWDTQDNSSEAELWFSVFEKEVFLAQVRNYPNPFADETWICLTHMSNVDDGPLDIMLEVFDVMGRRVSVMHHTVETGEDSMQPIRWSAGESVGAPLRSGVYFYKLTLTDADGRHRSVNQKMVISR